MENTLKITLAQLDLSLGDIVGNTEKIIHYSCLARDQYRADIVVFPELAITAYPPEDLLLRPELHHRIREAIKEIQSRVSDIHMIIGHPTQISSQIFNSASVIYNGKIKARYDKQLLPNYSVFDEKRYFAAGSLPCVFTVNHVPIGIVICEDLWHPGPTTQSVRAGAQIILSPNASPFHRNKPTHRIEVVRQRVAEAKVPIVYVNCLGGQDELVFDGGSFALSHDGQVQEQMPLYEEGLATITVNGGPPLLVQPGQIAPLPEETEGIYRALVLGTRDYLAKNHVKSALVGLSGGIDSALTLCIAVDAIGAENTWAVMMPSRYTSEMSLSDAETLAQTLGVRYSTIPIEPIFESFLDALKPAFAGSPADITEENLQARCRGTLLMALSNKFGHLVLTTGNKSEMAMGYATLYGDMAGGFAVLKDVSKTLVYQLASYRNQKMPVIPARILERPPSAELAHGQLDQDSLPPYPILDQIIYYYVEHDEGRDQIIARGFDPETVTQVIHRLDRSEYKRRQSPPGIRISSRAFGRDWRYPITSNFDVAKTFRRKPKDEKN